MESPFWILSEERIAKEWTGRQRMAIFVFEISAEEQRKDEVREEGEKAEVDYILGQDDITGLEGHCEVEVGEWETNVLREGRLQVIFDPGSGETWSGEWDWRWTWCALPHII
jgi:hypothetical protein